MLAYIEMPTRNGAHNGDSEMLAILKSFARRFRKAAPVAVQPESHSDRARMITARMRVEMVNTGRTMHYTFMGAIAALAVMSGAVGYSLPTAAPGIYELVEFHGDESDIIDYDLSATDCAGYLDTARRAGRVVICQLVK
jgi:hypothetical protein